MSDIKTSVIVDLAGNLQRRAQAYSKSLSRFSATGQRSLKILSRAASGAGRVLDRAGNKYTGLLTGAAAAGTGKFVVELQTRFTRLGIQANKSAEEINVLKNQIFDIASAPVIRVDPGKITSAIEEIVEKTGDLEFAQANIRNIGLALQATGAEGTAIGGILAELQKIGIKDPRQVLEAIDTLNVQGKEGAFTLQNLASLGPRVVTAYTSLGRTGLPALREMGAALQIIRQGTGSSEQAATSFEALLRTFADAKKIKQLQAGGIQVFDPDELKKGKEVLRPINLLISEIITKTQGKKTLLSAVFDAEAIRAFNSASTEFQLTGQINSLEKFMQVQGDGTTTLNDSARAAKDASAAMTNLFTAWKRFSDERLTGPIQGAADILNSLSSDTTGNIIGGTLAAGAGIFAGRKAFKVGSFIKNLLSGGASVAPKVAGIASGVSTLTGLGKKNSASFLARTGAKALPLARFAGPLAAAGTTGFAAGTVLNETLIRGTGLSDAIGSAISNTLAFFGNEEAKASVKLMEAFEKSQQAENFNGLLKIQIDNEGRAEIKQLSTDNKNIDLLVNSGLTMPGAL